jgi:histidine triad (HIT) family protein
MAGLPAVSGQPCLFCQVAAGESPAFVVYSDDHVVAFLDRRPVFRGHCLVVPRPHYETLLELPAALMEPLFSVVQLLARAAEEGLGADGTWIAINNTVSQSVAHVHVHVVPRRHDDGLRGFFWPRQRYRDEAETEEFQRAIREAVARLQEA